MYYFYVLNPHSRLSGFFQWQKYFVCIIRGFLKVTYYPFFYFFLHYYTLVVYKLGVRAHHAYLRKINRKNKRQKINRKNKRQKINTIQTLLTLPKEGFSVTII